MPPQRKEQRPAKLRECDDCDEMFISSSEFSNHLLDPLCNVFICLLCAEKQTDTEFPNQCQLTKHTIKDHLEKKWHIQKEKGGDKKFTCEMCSLYFRTKYYLKKHQQLAETCSKISELQTQSKSKKAKLSSSVSIQFEPHENNQDRIVLDGGAVKNESFPCTYCGMEFDGGEQQEEHMRSEHMEGAEQVEVTVKLENIELMCEDLEVKEEVKMELEEEVKMEVEEEGKMEVEEEVKMEVEKVVEDEEKQSSSHPFGALLHAVFA